ncbi:hypothetical protein EIP91_003798 [Steccherinum ochraceum]|uniref:DNA 3'-5' helicase n=1 Tax=Steccherinum ochraceum TaxID=92696 RepID=A0A4R0RQK0_9APHY|nr:hypothetical protein EIP91_003798 [Steccherinum ochraceum]
MSETDSPSAGLQYSSQRGKELVREIIHKSLYDPHDYQLEGVCKSLDGCDLLSLLATGGGKTGFFSMFMLVLHTLSINPTLQAKFNIKFPIDPAMIIVYPTNGLEEEMARSFNNIGLPALAINSDTLQDARDRGQPSLWVQARSGYAMILLSPEQLVSSAFDSLLQNKIFQRRLVRLGIDEAHLLNSWGLQFRKTFTQLGFVRARMASHVKIIAVTATLMDGKPFNNVCDTLGLVRGQFHLVHRTNVRPELRMVFRRLSHGLGGLSFPDFAWIVRDDIRTVVYCPTIALTFRVTMYLMRQLPPSSQPTKRIRTYTALNWSRYNEETRNLLHDPDSSLQVVVATAAFMVGLDFATIARMVIAGHTATLDDLLQLAGRAGRDSTLVRDAQCITYLTNTACEDARRIVDGEPPRRNQKSVTQKKGGGKQGIQMDAAMADMIHAPCKTAAQNRLYNNPPPSDDLPCTCTSCAAKLSFTASPFPSSMCSCSGVDGTGCCPETNTKAAPAPIHAIASPSPIELLSTVAVAVASPVPSKPKRVDNNPVPRGLRVTRDMRPVAERRLDVFRYSVYNGTSSALYRCLPATAFLPLPAVKRLLDRFALYKSHEDLQELTKDYRYLHKHSQELWLVCEELAVTFEEMRRQKAEKKAKDKETKAMEAEKGGQARDEVDEDEPEEDGDENDLEVFEDELDSAPIDATSSSTAATPSNVLQPEPTSLVAATPAHPKNPGPSVRSTRSTIEACIPESMLLTFQVSASSSSTTPNAPRKPTPRTTHKRPASSDLTHSASVHLSPKRARISNVAPEKEVTKRKNQEPPLLPHLKSPKRRRIASDKENGFAGT